MDDKEKKRGLTPYLSPLGAWALALGASVGWGSLVVTCNTYLLHAGPAGSILGLLAGMALMLVVARNYSYLINAHPEAGGAYAYAREVFGYDHGFLTAWFLGLVYLAMLWANATSLPLFARYFMGDMFQFGPNYSIFGYDVFPGEALLSIAAIALVALLCARYRKVTSRLMIGLVALFALGIAACFLGAVAGGGSAHAFDPAFLPDAGELGQVIFIASVSPWAFVGFESISHSAAEFSFPHRKVFRILVAAVAAATALYAMILVLSTSAFPSGYANWFEYISDLGSLSGIEALPPFYAAYCYLGDAGVGIMMLVLLALVITSLVANIVALSRLVYALALDDVLPRGLAGLNGRDVPEMAVWLVALVSLPIPFLGRVAVGWIVDVTTIGAVLIYGYVSAAAFKMAGMRGDSVERTTGIIGLGSMIVLGLYLLLPNLVSQGTMAPESYLLFIVWGILGFLCFRAVLSRDKQKRFGQSIVVWIAMLSLVVFISFVWMSQSLMSATDYTMEQIGEYFSSSARPAVEQEADAAFIGQEVRALEDRLMQTMLAAAAMFTTALVMMLSNFAYMARRMRKSEEQLVLARGVAYTDPLTHVKSKNAYVLQEHELEKSISASICGPFAVVVCDVNGLKYVNDTYGHKAGDEYIKQASALICKVFDHSPVYRVGGDEFVAVLQGDDYDARERLVAELDAQSVENIGSDAVVVAVGMSDYVPDEDRDVSAVFNRADERMYRRKQELKALGARTR